MPYLLDAAVLCTVSVVIIAVCALLPVLVDEWRAAGGE